ncbi:unnamed protein product [Heligmosomoides polygyrus]|uniref:DUF4817 domain-containing protein n=1 Tax=Heligmosomoides polygyrus TaxID=6339 RepID=A0A183GIP5_HELPZ|nr:unnamed protein product [Heligmosomoides polygyrus]
MVSLEDRSAVVAMFKRASSVSTTSKMLKLHRMQVHRVIKRFEETGGIENRPRGRLRQTARTHALRNAVKDKLHQNPARNIRKLAKEHNLGTKVDKRKQFVQNLSGIDSSSEQRRHHDQVLEHWAEANFAPKPIFHRYQPNDGKRSDRDKGSRFEMQRPGAALLLLLSACGVAHPKSVFSPEDVTRYSRLLLNPCTACHVTNTLRNNDDVLKEVISTVEDLMHGLASTIDSKAACDLKAPSTTQAFALSNLYTNSQFLNCQLCFSLLQFLNTAVASGQTHTSQAILADIGVAAKNVCVIIDLPALLHLLVPGLGDLDCDGMPQIIEMVFEYVLSPMFGAQAQETCTKLFDYCGDVFNP